MNRVIETARQAAASGATVFCSPARAARARACWRVRSTAGARARRDRSSPSRAPRCRSISLESELFGHVKGAFTGAWKDKAGRLEAASRRHAVPRRDRRAPRRRLQAKLLRFLEERRFERVGGTTTIEVDARIVAATNRALEAEVARGAFREDLFYRLNVLRIELPAAARAARRLARARPPRAGDARRALRPRRCSSSIPRRRRCLPATAGQATYASSSTCSSTRWWSAAVIGCASSDLPDRLHAPRRQPRAAPNSRPTAVCRSRTVERRHIERVLADSATLEEAAARLGISSTTLWRKRKRWGID